MLALVKRGRGMFLVGLFFLGSQLGFLEIACADLRSKIDAALAERHPKDTPEWWRGLGAEAVPILLQIRSESTSPFLKVRAVEALGWYTGRQEFVPVLREVCEQEKNSTLKIAAIKSLVRSQGESQLEFVSQYLSDEDAQVRYATARALQESNLEPAKKLVTEYRKKEKVSWILEKLDHGLPEVKGSLTPVAENVDLAVSVPVKPKKNGPWQGRGTWIAFTDRKPIELTVSLDWDTFGRESGKLKVLSCTVKNKTRECKTDAFELRKTEVSDELKLSTSVGVGAVSAPGMSGAQVKVPGLGLSELKVKFSHLTLSSGAHESLVLHGFDGQKGLLAVTVYRLGR